MTVEYSLDEEGSWSEIEYSQAQQSDTWTLIEINETGIPSADAVVVRFSKDNGQQYRLEDIRLFGEEGEITPTGKGSDVPESFALNQNYPNPFNPSTSIRYEIPETQRVRLAVYDMTGRQVTVLVDGLKPSGAHEINWDATNLSSGIYLYTLEADEFRITRKMTLIK